MCCDKLRERIGLAGYTVSDFCKAINISESAFYKRLSQKTDFKSSEIIKIAELLYLSEREVDEMFLKSKISVLETKK